MNNPLNGNKIFQQRLSIIRNDYELSGLLDDVLKLFETNEFSSQKLDELLKLYDVSDYQLKDEIIDFIIIFCEKILKDKRITKSEIENLTFLKYTFKIKEGELFKNRTGEVKYIIKHQYSLITEDNIITDSEELFAVEMQGLFDLSYDDFYKIINEN